MRVIKEILLTLTGNMPKAKIAHYYKTDPYTGGRSFIDVTYEVEKNTFFTIEGFLVKDMSCRHSGISVKDIKGVEIEFEKLKKDRKGMFIIDKILTQNGYALGNIDETACKSLLNAYMHFKTTDYLNELR